MALYLQLFRHGFCGRAVLLDNVHVLWRNALVLLQREGPVRGGAYAKAVSVLWRPAARERTLSAASPRRASRKSP